MTGGPRFTHLNDLEWQEVRRQQHGQRVVSVREKWLEFNDRYLSLYAKWDPGAVVQAYEDELDGYEISKGTIRFQPDRPLPASLVKKLLKARIARR